MIAPHCVKAGFQINFVYPQRDSAINNIPFSYNYSELHTNPDPLQE
jgi:hypothetical protein